MKKTLDIRKMDQKTMVAVGHLTAQAKDQAAMEMRTSNRENK